MNDHAHHLDRGPTHWEARGAVNFYPERSFYVLEDEGKPVCGYAKTILNELESLVVLL